MSNNELSMNARYAERFASLALAHVRREFPNKLDHIILDAGDAKGPRALHPIFFGSFDWHSCVHGYWLLARMYRRYPEISQRATIRGLFDEMITPENVAVEVAYASHPGRATFERPYGWAWAMQLCAELRLHETPEGQRWCETLAPLGAVFAERFIGFLPKATYPIRVGTHFNSAFAITLAMDYAEQFGNSVLINELETAARRWFTGDTNAEAWEPGGDDFLSGTLMEAVCMSRVVSADEFRGWFARFLPDISLSQPRTLFTPAFVSDRSDGKIGHLDGLNLSRAWCWRVIARQWPDDDIRRTTVLNAADRHMEASLPHIAGDYAGEHWLATYATLALEA